MPAPALDSAIGTSSATPTPETPSPPFATYLAYLSQLIPLQRAVLLLNLQKAHSLYAERVKQRRAHMLSLQISDNVKAEGPNEQSPGEEAEVDEVKQVLIECRLWNMVEEEEVKAGQEVDKWHVQGQAPDRLAEFQLVQIK